LPFEIFINLVAGALYDRDSLHFHYLHIGKSGPKGSLYSRSRVSCCCGCSEVEKFFNQHYTTDRNWKKNILIKRTAHCTR